MKSNNKKSTTALRFGRLGMISLMALSLSVGRVVSAAELELWSLKDKTELTHLSDKENTDAVNWLVKKPDLNKFVKTFRTEPLKFAEGIVAGWQEAAKDKAKVADFKKSLTEGMEKMSDHFFDEGNRREEGTILKQAYLAFLKQIFDKKNKADTEDLLVDSFGKLSDGVKVALNVTNEDPNAGPTVGEQFGNLSLAQLEEMKNLACAVVKPDSKEQELAKTIEALNAEIAALKKKTTPAVDEDLLARVDALNAELTRAREQDAQFDPNQFANNQKEQDDLGAIFNRLLGNEEEEDDNGALAALGQQRNQQLIPPTTDNNRGDDTDLLSSAPLPVPDQQPGIVPAAPPATVGSNTPVTFDIGMNPNVKPAEMTELDNQRLQNSIRTKFNATSMIDPQVAQVNLQSNIKKSISALAAAESKLADMDTKIATISSDADTFIGQPSKNELASRKAALDAAQAAVDNQNKLVSNLRADSPQREVEEAKLSTMSQDLTNKQTAYNTYNSSVTTARTSIAAQGKALQTQRDNLAKSIQNLKGQIEEMSTEEQLASTKVAQNLQQYAAGGTTANFLKAGGSNRGGNTTRRPSRVGAAMGAQNSGKSRGSLGVR